MSPPTRDLIWQSGEPAGKRPGIVSPGAGAAADPVGSALLHWYDRHRRVLPWRAVAGQTADPYRVWLSEIMLQQTTVAAVMPYYKRFLLAFPDVQSLAAAPATDIMKAWAGLGYYARARNLHACAKAVAMSGGFPRTVEGLRALPGIGEYTAKAVAAIAFGVPVVPVDGNVERVTSRVFAIEQPFPAARRAIALAAATLGDDPAARARPSDFAQALFDLGATICTRDPACGVCPLVHGCAGFRAGIAATLPRKAAKPVRPVRHGAMFWLEDREGRVLLRVRPGSGLLSGMTELPGTPWRDAPWREQEAVRQAPQTATWRPMGEVRHVFTHFALRLDVYAALVDRIAEPEADDSFLRPVLMLHQEALPSVMRKCVAVARSGSSSDLPA